MNNLIDYKNFRDKNANAAVTEKVENTEAINENVIVMDDAYRVQCFVDVPKSLVTGYLNKVKNETGKKAGELYSETQIAELISNYITSNFLNIENLPVDIAMGTTKTPVQTQAQVQTQMQTQPVQETPAQTQPVQETPAQGTAQTPAQGTAQTPAQGTTQTQGTAQQTPQSVAQTVPSQEI